MISGFYVQQSISGAITAKWSPKQETVKVYRSRVAIRIPPPPWGLVDGDTLNILVPRLAGQGSTLKTITFTGSLPTTPQEMVDYINGLRLGVVEAVLGPSNTTYICVVATTPFIQVVTHNTTVMAKFSLHNELITTNSHWELIGAVDPSGADPLSEYDSFEDAYGTPVDNYKLEDTSDGIFTCVRSSAKVLSSGVCCVEGTILSLNGTARQNIGVSAHEIPPSEPDLTTSPDTPLSPPGWPVNILRPLEVIPPAKRNTLWHDTLTDSNGFFSIPCSRGHRIWLEIRELGWSAILDVPDATYVDISQLPSWRRSGMLGPVDTSGGAGYLSDSSKPSDSIVDI